MATLPAGACIADERVRTPWSEFWRKFKRQKVAMIAGVFVIALVALAFAAPWIAPSSRLGVKLDYQYLDTLGSQTVGGTFTNTAAGRQM